jgi:hypothetical protein
VFRNPTFVGQAKETVLREWVAVSFILFSETVEVSEHEKQPGLLEAV